MVLTAAEFCLFNLNSRIHLLQKDGLLIVIREIQDKYIVKLYRIYKFLVEVVVSVINGKVLKVEPVINSDILKLYL